MTHNNTPDNFITKHVAKDDDLDFVESPFYWQNCNPSALTKTWHGFLSVVGNENDNNICDNPDDKTEFESEIIRTNSSIEEFRQFIEDGQKFGTINITNAECSNFDLLKRMYGSVIYVVFEYRGFNKKDPRLKKGRHISFFTEHDLCILNPRLYCSDESYYQAISNKIVPSIITSSGQLRKQPNDKETSLEKTRKKLYRNGFTLNSPDNRRSYVKPHIPTREEYFSSKDVERLDSQDMMNLLWTAICDAHRDDGNVPEERRNISENLAFYLYHFNIIGFGWMPCLFAKQELNELDKCILYMYEKSNLQNELNKLENGSEPVKKQEDPPGMHKVLIFRNMNGNVNDKDGTFNPHEHLPLNKIAKIDRELGHCIITDVAGKKILTDFIDLVNDVPRIDIQMSPEIPGQYIVTGKYADGRCLRYEMNELEWREHSYEIDQFIPGSRQAIQNFNMKQAEFNGEISSHEYSTKLRWTKFKDEDLDDLIENVIDNTKPSYIKVPEYIKIPEYTYSSIGTDYLRTSK